MKRFCTRHYQRWLRVLKQLQGNYDFVHEARRLVEEALLNDFTCTLPITGDDIMQTFQIRPGPQVRILLEQARIFLKEGILSREAILEKLPTWHNTS